MVFLDYQNIFLTAHEQFQPRQVSARTSHLDPLRLGHLLVERRDGNATLTGVRVYRGLPVFDRQPDAAAANDRQTSAWSRSPLVTTVRRPLRYPRGWPNVRSQEKGVDVALAIDYVRLALEGAYDVGILVSRDTDLVPALETVIELNLAHVEVATWVGCSRLRLPASNRPWCHYLSAADFQSVLDPTDYTVSR